MPRLWYLVLLNIINLSDDIFLNLDTFKFKNSFQDFAQNHPICKLTTKTRTKVVHKNVGKGYV